jgi:methylene-tetrahydromethanopterin dehydrogenase
MEAPYILHMLSLKHVSPFDVNMALDAGFTTAVCPYTAVELGDVAGLTQDAIFSRGPKGGRTGIFIGGKNAILALDMLAAARKAMFRPSRFRCSPIPRALHHGGGDGRQGGEGAEAKGGGLSGRSVAVFGATGVVGFASGVIAAAEGAKTILIGYDGAARVKALAELAKERFKVDLAYADGSSEALKEQAIKDVDVILAAGRAGVQIVSVTQLAKAPSLKVAADVNAVPPAGIEGLGAQDDGVALKGSGAVGIGSLAIGAVKYKVQSGLFRRMIEAEKPLFLDFRDAFALAREIVG